MQSLFIFLIASYLLISLFIAVSAQVLKEFLFAMIIMVGAVVLIFRYLL